MKTYTATTRQNGNFKVSGRDIVPGLAASMREILALLSAVTVATLFVLVSVWVAGTEMTNIASALTWAIGLVFLGIALDNRGPLAYFQLVTGLFLLVLSYLQNSISPDFTIVSGALLAAWASIALFGHLR
jgi:hypothetical protein